MEAKQEVFRFVGGLAAGEMAVQISNEVGGRVLERFGDKVFVLVSAPLVEESTKTGISNALGGNVFLSHVYFGAREGYYYALKEGVHHFHHMRPILHASFGLLYVMGEIAGGKAVGFLSAFVGHVLWNTYSLINQGHKLAHKAGEIRETNPRKLRRELFDEVKKSLMV